MLQHVILLLVSFFLLWVGSGYAVSAVTKISAKIHASSFFVSFLVLGLLTSLTEIVVGVSAFIANEPDVFVGNLLGSSMVLFLFVVPLLAIVGNGISLNHTFSFKDLVLSAFVVGIPAVMTLDGNITVVEAIIMVALYGYLLFTVGKSKAAIPEHMLTGLGSTNTKFQLLTVIFSIICIIAGAQLLIKETVFLGEFFSIPSFIVSLILVSIGTNIPELSIGIRAILAKKKGIAFGNYVGSAAFNTFQLGVLSFLYGKAIPAEGSNYSVILYVIGLMLFLYFAKSRYILSRNEGLIILVIYIALIIFELLTGPGWKIL